MMRLVRIGFVLWLACGLAMAGDHDHGHGRGHNKDHGHGHGHAAFEWTARDRAYVRGWYEHQERDLPPGLAKRDRLPPGLERQLEERGELPPGLRRRLEPCPESLWRHLPPPPPDCRYGLVGGHLVLYNRRNFSLLVVFHFGR